MKFAYMLTLLTLAACGSPIVGIECAEGLTQCGTQCVRVSSDPFHCGGCDQMCANGQLCQLSMCVDVDDGGLDVSADAGPDANDGGVPEGGLDDGGLETGLGDGGFVDGLVETGPTDGSNGDGSNGDGSIGDGSIGDGSIGDVMAPDVGVVVCDCDLGELCCDDRCVQPDRDPLNCGMCAHRCAGGEVCAAGMCEPLCPLPLVLCSGLCIDTMTDRDNCGGCGIRCASGICRDGMCVAATEGHVVLIGHTYETGRVGQNFLAGNTAMLPFHEPVDVLVYEGGANAASMSGVDRAFNQVASRRGRTWNRIVATTPEEVPLFLANASVFVVYAQSISDDLTLRTLGAQWATAFRAFLRNGGVIVVFDGAGSHSGSWQIIDEAGLFDAGGRTEVAGDTLEVVARGDAIAREVPLNYLGESTTVYFDMAPPGTIVVAHPDGPVAIHFVLNL